MTAKLSIGNILTAFAAVVLVIFLCVGMAFGCGAYTRYQARADNSNHRKITLLNAHNRVSVSNVEIQNQEQRVRIAKQKAVIRYQNAIGVRRAQDEIAKTLTPLYVQFEMVDALKSIAASGSNNSVVYLPAGANGVPLVSTLPGPVTLPKR